VWGGGEVGGCGGEVDGCDECGVVVRLVGVVVRLMGVMSVEWWWVTHLFPKPWRYLQGSDSAEIPPFPNLCT